MSRRIRPIDLPIIRIGPGRVRTGGGAKPPGRPQDLARTKQRVVEKPSAGRGSDELLRKISSLLEDQRADRDRADATYRLFIEALARLKNGDSPSTAPTPGPRPVSNPRGGRAIELDGGRPLDPDAAERHYQALGRWKGPLASPEVQADAERFWLASGREGAAWLVRRLHPETQVDALHAAGSTLAGLGEPAVGPIVAALLDAPAPDQGVGLLKALGWMSEDPATPRLGGDSAAFAILSLLQDEDPDLREAAARATLILPAGRAARCLKARLAVEPDEDVRSTIREGLDRLGSVEA